MTEMSDWIWLVVAVFWVATRILPRLFRKQNRPTARRAAKTVRAPQPSEKRSGAFSNSAGVPVQGGQAKPIEPK